MASPNANMVDETQTLNTSQHEHKTEAQGGEIYGGSSAKLWSMYLTEIEKQDKEMVERWKGEADSALMFAGLFSAVVSVSLVESYKWLSPDPGNETVKLLTQISQQLVNISNGIPLESIAAEISQPFKPTSSALVVNIMWFGSIVLCLACSVLATSIQQRARRYLALTQGRGTPSERARLQTSMFNGLKRFQVERTHQSLAMSMHLSILLYCMGLFIYIFPINTTIASFALGYLSIFYLIYAILTVLPTFFFDCPYGTPFSALMWRISHAFLLGFLRQFDVSRAYFMNPCRSYGTGHRTIAGLMGRQSGGKCSKSGSTHIGRGFWTANRGASNSTPLRSHKLWTRIRSNGLLQLSSETTQTRRSRALPHGCRNFLTLVLDRPPQRQFVPLCPTTHRLIPSSASVSSISSRRV
ncbi:hypothetical protein BJY52DRAFT_1390697 [Lactarius psammicola]|nr:hypothetical protein BJY52DRAFT_1390697 [Lactarius psammicola]